MANNVIAKISADISELKTELTKGLAEFKQFGERVPKTVPEDPFKKLKEGVQELAQITGAAAPFVAAGKQAAEYDQALRDVNKIMKLSEDGLASYGEKLRTMSIEMGVATKATEAAAAAERIASAGFEDAASNAKMLEATLSASTAGKVDAGQYAQFLAQTLQGYGASADDAARYTDILFRAVQEGITEIPELANTLGRVTGIAGSAGVSFEELGAIMATTTLRGSTTSSAVDGLRGAIVNLQAPSKQARAELERIGVVAGEATLKKQGLIKTLQDIAQANGNSAESWKIILGDIQAVDVAQKLMVDGGAKVTESITDMGNAAGYTAEAVAEHMKGAVANWDAFTSSLEAAGIAVGANFLPAVVTVLQTGTKMVNMFATAPPVLQTVFTAVAALGAASTISAKAIVLLTTAAQRERLALLASRAAKIGNMQASVALTAATIKTQISLNALIGRLTGSAVAANTATISFSSLATAMKAAMIANPFGVTVAALALVGAGLMTLTRRQEEANKAAEQHLQTQEKMAGFFREQKGAILEVADALQTYAGSADAAAETVAKSFLDAKKDETDVAKMIAGLVQQLNQAQEAGNVELAADISKRIDVLYKVRDDIRATLEKQRAAEEKAPVGRSDNDKISKEVAKRQEAERKKALSADLHAIDVKKKAGELSARQELEALEAILKAKGATLKIEERQRIEAEIAAAQGKIKADNEKRWADAAKKTAEAGKTAAKESMDLKRSALETERDGKKTLEEKLEIEKQLVDLEAQKALYGEKNAKNRQAILDNAKAEKDLLDKKAAEAIEKRDAELAVKRGALVAAQAAEEEATQADAFAKRRKHLEEEEARGKNVRYERLRLEEEEIRAAETSAKRKLELAKAEIEAKRKAADAGASPEEQKINADNAAVEMQKAEREAAKDVQAVFDLSNQSLMERTKYLREQLELLRKQKEEAKGATFGGPYGPEGLNENQSGWGVSRKKRGGAKNQDGMTESELEREIAKNEGILGNRRGRFDRTGEAGAATFGVKRSEREAAAAAAAKEPVDYGAAVTTIVELLKAIAGGKMQGAPATNQSPKQSPALQPMGVPYTFIPNSQFG